MENESESASADIAWDETLAAQLLDAVVLVGLTFVDHEDNPTSQEQFWGRMVRVDRQEGIQIDLRGVRSGSDYWLPPDTRGFQRAAPGEYRLHTTDEVVVNPDFICTWTITEPDH